MRVALCTIVVLTISVSFAKKNCLKDGRKVGDTYNVGVSEECTCTPKGEEWCHDRTDGSNVQTLEGDNFKPLDCYDVLKAGNKRSGVYSVYPFGVRRAVYCDQETAGGGWLVFQRRRDGSEDFYRGWYVYQRGFGNISNEFWIGNQFLNQLTSQRTYSLRVDMENFENETKLASYENFSIGAAPSNYALHIGTYSGTAGDSLSAKNGAPFSTKDQDNDSWPKNCAFSFKGAWWYTKCHSSNLNGLYLKGHHRSYANGVNWRTWKGYHYSLKGTEMKCRPALL